MLKDKSIIGTIVIGLIVIISTIALLVGFSQAGYVDNDQNMTDKDLAWQIANWGVDAWFARDPKDLIGKDLGVYVGSTDSQATIKEVSAYCLSHLGQTGGGHKYKILNIIDVDTNISDYINGKPGTLTVYGGSEGNVWGSVTGNKVTDNADGKYASEGTEHAIELAYLATNAYENKETSVTETASKGPYKLALQNSFWRWYKQLIKSEENGGIGINSNLVPDTQLNTWYEATANIQQEAYDYAKKLSNYRFIDKSIEGQQAVVYNAEKNITYIGPYQLGIQETTAEAFKINNGEITAEGFTEYMGGDLIKDVKTLPSSTDFYIGVKGNKVNDINKVQVISWTTNVISARLAFLQIDGGQNLVLYGGKKQDKQAIVDLPLSSTNPLVLKVKKVDASTKNPLPNVGFKIVQDVNGLYVEQDLNGNIIYTSLENEATEFKTDLNGMMEIRGLQPGTYSLYETKNPNQGYEVDGSKTATVSVPSSGAQVVENYKKQQVILKIIKEGWNNAGTRYLERLDDVEFIVQDSITGQYLQGTINGKMQYTTNKNNAKIYTTENNGEVVIEGLQERQYNIYEINNPNELYMSVSSTKPAGTTYQLKIGSNNIIIKNRRRTSRRWRW